MAERLSDTQELIYGTPFRERMHALLLETPWWAIAVALHIGLLFFAKYYTWEPVIPQAEVEIQSNIEEKIEMPPVVMELPKPVEVEIKRTDKRITTEKKVSLQQKNLPQINDILTPGNPNPNLLPVLAAPGGVIRVGRIGEGEGLHVGGGGIGEGMDDMGGWPGWKGRCIAVWLFDESRSMKPHQKVVRQKVDELYENLGITAGGVADNKKVVTVVCSYGKDLHVLLKEPTADMAKIREAIDNVPVDTTGVENYLGAINGVVNEFSGYAKKYSRNIVIIVVTDEGGDDDVQPKEGPAPLEVVLDRMKKAKASLLVFGYEAGAFGWSRELTFDPTVPAGTDPYAFVNRGIESAFAETVPRDLYFRGVERVPSGFGPYGMSRLCRETGGVYYLMRESDAKSYDYEKLLKGYQPELDSRSEIAAHNAKNSMRKLIMGFIDAWNFIGWGEGRRFEPYFWNNEGLQNQIDGYLKITDDYTTLVNDAIKRMNDMANVSFADTPSGKRWEANRDFLWAQLHKTRFQLNQFRIVLLELKSGKNIPPAGDIGWYIDCWGRPVQGDPEKLKVEMDQIRALYQAVIDKHAGTPWAVLAGGEMNNMHSYPVKPYSRSGDSNVTTEGR